MKHDPNIINNSDFLRFVVARKDDVINRSSLRVTQNMDRSLYSNIMYQKKYSPNISRSLLVNSENNAGLMGKRIATEKEHIVTMNKLFAQML